MKELVPKEVLDAFTSYNPGLPKHSTQKTIVERIGNGLINHSYKVKSNLKDDFFLQQINKNVFQRPQDVQENYIRIAELAEIEFPGLLMPRPLFCGQRTTLFVDNNENFWRAFEWIKESKTINTAENAEQAKDTAKAFAKFTAANNSFDVNMLKEVIPGFHNLSLRYNQFEQSLNTELYERMGKAAPLVKELKGRERYRHFFEIITESPEFPKRVMHHDAKIGNVLFHEQTGEVICLVDYDTVMPGYFFSDLGDMIRSMAVSCDENCKEPEKISIDKDFYEAIISGYTDVLGEQLTSSERKYLHIAGVLMIYMQSLRFITDYFNGDIYYQTEYSEQNFDRAFNQLTLLKRLEEFLMEKYGFKI